ncbi:dTDP-4-dehydrorhamnose 3,5-epimerase [Sporomusa sp.]|jgi:dTDP-4-dehydrorhamnose 3,5-epimerase|uniref:dTDP-4-dehydrorhamnose 3,5-epimerase n=1 Tax=Sporomusa sp. TaxID=2078658 RepID=UPI002B6EA1D8|nr:dTDP-4-dehydrorhamnose 3,5-epimerase [Sporomusa sp.]HWR06290.1 dTDP-4-dehydrorhamnose 3,5-epimerase [Sporomusa sp.]HWR41841.1 dTDP-4-dehydrorhamnose 3,5-epimerase [Sporomusa sp.]
MRCYETSLPDVKIFEPEVFEDSRGFFMETWNSARYLQWDIPTNFVQDNLSLSTKGILRGLHYQQPNPQGKLVYVLQGEVFDVAVDIRYGSPTFGHWVGIILSAQNRRQMYVPEGFAHGFCVMSETALFAYKCTDFYSPPSERGIFWNDPDLKINWPISHPTLSEKDKQHLQLRDIAVEYLPVYR